MNGFSTIWKTKELIGPTGSSGKAQRISMMTLAAGTALEGRYRILEKIGEGGFGVVYKAYDWQRNRQVAIKQTNMAALSAQEKIEVTDSFNREVTLLSSLKHESLPRIYDHFTDPEHWYVVMDYIEGRTLEDVLKTARGGRLPIRKVLAIGIALCDVLGYLHTQGPPIIFRDVKPGNIMITRSGRLYLIDFGIARRYRPGQTQDTGPLGSPGYAAPEQYGKAQTTPQTDIYGLGATLQTLLTGKEPLEIHVSGLPTDLRIPWELQALLLRMMERDSSKRPRDVEEVRRALVALNVSAWQKFKAWPIWQRVNAWPLWQRINRRPYTKYTLAAALILDVAAYWLLNPRITSVSLLARFWIWLILIFFITVASVAVISICIGICRVIIILVARIIRDCLAIYHTIAALIADLVNMCKIVYAYLKRSGAATPQAGSITGLIQALQQYLQSSMSRMSQSRTYQQGYAARPPRTRKIRRKRPLSSRQARSSSQQSQWQSPRQQRRQYRP